MPVQDLKYLSGDRQQEKRRSIRINLALGPFGSGKARKFPAFTWHSSLQLPRSSSSSFLRTPLHPSALQKPRSDMDFSQLNSAEQAQMTKILEKKQVWFSRSRAVATTLLTVQ